MAKPEKIEAIKAALRNALAAVERSQTHGHAAHEDACLISAIHATRDAETLLVRTRNYTR